MLISLLMVLIGGYLIGYLFEKINIPKIVGMIIIGILIGPSFLNIIDEYLINISSYLRKIALVIIITRAGLNLDVKSIKDMGINALLISFIPATFEIIGVTFFSYLLLNTSIIEGILLGSVLAAVSPAIVVPRMIKLKEKGYKSVSGLVLIGSSIDDIYVIVIFYAMLSAIKTNSFSFISIIQIPSSIILGAIVGLIIGIVIYYIFSKIKINKYILLIILFIITNLLVFNEDLLFSVVNVSTLISVLSMFIYFNYKNKDISSELEISYKKLWLIFEILLFVLVGISVDVKYAISSGFMPVVVLLLGLIVRSIGTYIALSFTKYNLKEKIFIIFSYLPKATVQASIGGILLSEGLVVGNLSLTIAVLSILITAPLGAILIDNTYKRLLKLEIN